MQRKSRIITRAAVGIGALGLLGGLAGPAFAAPPPSGGGTTQASIMVGEVLTFAFTAGGTGFTVPPGGTQAAADAFTISTNDALGYDLSQYAPDLTSGPNTIPATNLTTALHYTTSTGTNALGSPHNLGNIGGPNELMFTTTAVSLANGDTFSEDFTSAPLLANQPYGDYTTTITYVAAGN